MKLSKKVGAIVASLALVGGGVSACSSGTSSNDANGKVTINWGFWDQGDAGDKAWSALADKVHKKFPNITVKMTSPPFADYFTKLQSQLAAGTTPCIMSMQSLRLPAFADTMMPLDDVMKKNGFDPSDWKSGGLKALQFKGKQYAIPYGLSSMILYYNKAAFKKAGVQDPKIGWTTSDFEAAAKKLTKSTGKPAFGQSFSDLHMFSLLYADNGAKPVSDEAKLQLTSPKMEKAFNWYSSLATKMNVSSVPASASDVPWGEQQFTAGNVAMAVDGSWNLTSDATEPDFPVGVVTLPQGPNGGGTFSANSGFGISKTCKNKEAAAKALSVIVGPQGAKTALSQGNEPARIADNDSYFKSVGKQMDSKVPGFSKQAKKVLKASGNMATPFISTDQWDQTTKDIARQFILAYTGDEDPKTALGNVQSAAQ